MHHVFFALFESTSEAEIAVREVEALGSDRKPFTVFQHPGGELVSSDLPIAETFSREGLLEGLALGAAVGGIGFALWAAMGEFTFGVFAGLLLGSVIGALVGGLYGLLVGAGNPDRVVVEMASKLRPEQVFLTIEAPGLTAEERAMDVCRRHGAHVKKKPLL